MSSHPGAELLSNVRRRNKMFHPTAHRRRYDTRFQRAPFDAVTQATPYHEFLSKKILVDREVRQSEAAPWSKVRPPTHFVAVRIPTQAHMVSAVEGMHEDATSAGLSSYTPLFAPLQRLHLTLSVATIDGFEQRVVEAPTETPTAEETEAMDLDAEAAAPAAESNAVAAVTAQRELVATSDKAEQQLHLFNGIVDDHMGRLKAAPVQLRFQGLGTFAGGRVVFVRSSAVDGQHERLAAAVRAMRKDLGKAGIDVKGNPHDDFVPHVTVAKINQRQQREFGVRKVPTELYDHARHFDFGSLTVGGADVCSMKGRSADGYYNVVHSV